MDAEGNDPTALRYGIRDVPTTLLLNKDGKVVSTEARGDDLAVLLEKLLGPPYSPKGALSFVDIQPMASRFDSGGEFNGSPKGEQLLLGLGSGSVSLLLYSSGVNNRWNRHFPKGS